MKIKVLKTTKAASCPAGISTKLYEEGQVYEMHDELAKVFIAQKWGIGNQIKKEIEVELIEGKAIEKQEIENKAVKKAPENKSLKVGKKAATKKSASKK